MLLIQYILYFYSIVLRTKKKYMNNVIEDLLYHQRNCCWSEEILQMSFLIKYCYSSAYRRLWILSNFKLPSPTTIDSQLSL